MRSQNFDRDRAIKARVERAVNFSHAACAEQRLDFVRAEFRARSKSHSGGAIIAWLASPECAASFRNLWIEYL